MDYRDRLLMIQEQVYRTVYEDIEKVRDTHDTLLWESDWEDVDGFERELVKQEDPELYDQIEMYLNAREDVREVLHTVQEYSLDLRQTDVPGAGRHWGDLEEYRFHGEDESGNRHPTSFVDIFDGYSDVLVDADDASEFYDGLRQAGFDGQIGRLDEAVPGWHETVWETMETGQDPGITTLAERYNIAYSAVMDEADELHDMIVDRINTVLLARLDRTSGGQAS